MLSRSGIAMMAACAAGLMCQGAAMGADYQTFATNLGGLATYWDMNETSGDAVDSVGSLDLTLKNNPGRVTDAAFDATFQNVGVGNRVATFSAASLQGMSVSDPTALQGTDSATLSYFVRFDGGTPTLALIMGVQRAPGDGSRYGFVNIVDTGKMTMTTTLTGNTAQKKFEMAAGATNTLADGAWHHVVSTYHYDAGDVANSVLAIYVDGVLQTSSLSTATTTGLRAGTAGDGFYIAYDPFDNAPTGARYLNGAVDEVAIFNRALSASEVADLYNAALIPEPGSMVLIGMGGLLLLRRR